MKLNMPRCKMKLFKMGSILIIVLASFTIIAQNSYSKKDIKEYSSFINQFIAVYADALVPLISTFKSDTVSENKITVALDQFGKKTNAYATVFADETKYVLMRDENLVELWPKLNIDAKKKELLLERIGYLKEAMFNYTQKHDKQIFASEKVVNSIEQLRCFVDTIGSNYEEIKAIEGLIQLNDSTNLGNSSSAHDNEQAEESATSEDDVQEYNARQIIDILNNDVFSYYKDDLKDYDTPLKKQVFKKTDEYKELLSTIREIAKKIKNGKVKMIDEPGDSLSDYDLKRNGFYYNVGANFTDYGAGNYPISKNGFCLDRIPTSKTKDIGGTIWRIFLPCDADTAVKIEKNNDIIFVYTFKVTGVVDKVFTTFVMGTGYTVSYKAKYVSVNNIELKIVNKTSNEVLKTYFYQ